MKPNRWTIFLIIIFISAINLTGCDIKADRVAQLDKPGFLSTTAAGAEETSSGEKTDPAENTSETAADGKESEAWQSNTGTITLGETITFSGKGVSVDGTTVTVTAGGDFTVKGTLKNGQILIDTEEKVKLRLSGADITCPSGPAIFFLNAQKAFITLTEGTVNRLTDGNSYTADAKGALFSNDTLEIKGSGTLYVIGNYKHGIASDDDIIIENGVLNINAPTDGIHANNNVTVSGGTLTLDSGSDGIESEGDIVIDGGTFGISAGDDGLHAQTELTVNGGTLDITKSNEGIESKGTVTVNDGSIKIKASDDGINAGTHLTVNGGYLYADCEGDGLDSNGNMTINGGRSVIYSGNNANGPIDIGERNSSFVINGGTVIATGGNMRINVSETSKQYSLWISGQFSAGKLVNIKSQAGREMATFSPVKSASLIFYSSDKLAADITCVAGTGGSSTGKATDGVYSGGTYTGGTDLGTATMSSKSAVIGSSGGLDGPGGPGRPGGR